MTVSYSIPTAQVRGYLQDTGADGGRITQNLLRRLEEAGDTYVIATSSAAGDGKVDLHWGYPGREFWGRLPPEIELITSNTLGIRTLGQLVDRFQQKSDS